MPNGRTAHSAVCLCGKTVLWYEELRTTKRVNPDTGSTRKVEELVLTPEQKGAQVVCLGRGHYRALCPACARKIAPQPTKGKAP